MEWYYVDNGQQAGPVSDSDLENLAQSGKVTPETLVWHAGLDNWKSYASVADTGKATPQAKKLTLAARKSCCAECGNEFPESEMIQFHTSWVCTTCKPVFFQRIQKNASLPGTLEYAGFGIRLGAKILDALIISTVTFIPIAGIAFMMFSKFSPEKLAMLINLFKLMAIGIGGVYTILTVGKYGATPGKMICKIKIVTPDGGKVSYARACGRYFAEFLSGIICYMGYIMAAFDNEKRSLHDRICATRVVKNL